MNPSDSIEQNNDCHDKYVTEVESIAEHPAKHKVASSVALSEYLSTSPLDLLRLDHTIYSYVVAESDLKAHERLCNWLDLYQVRGSADDRTLVLLTTGNI